MYYSSESSDSEVTNIKSSLDFSYLMMDNESLSVHLLNSVKEQNELQKKKKTNISMQNAEQANEASEEMHRLETNSLNTYCEDCITEKLFLQHNNLIALPVEITYYSNLKLLDLSNNSLIEINEFVVNIPNLQTLVLKNNSLRDDSLPKDLASLSKLRELNLSGNNFTSIPQQLFDVVSLKYLYIGSNQLSDIHCNIKNLQNLEVLHLGGNRLEKVPNELGELPMLSYLALCDNKIKRLPRPISQLKRLKSLLLHKNNFCCLPVEIVKLRSLTELSLRENPLVRGFVNCCAKDIYSAPSLLELAARAIKLNEVLYTKNELPDVLHSYLKSGQRCVNPKCKGMYFTSHVEHIKFVDFCGKYRVPLMHYLCSSRCSSNTPSYFRRTNSESSDSDEEKPDATLKKVLLG